jgi:hypothetical protein
MAAPAVRPVVAKADFPDRLADVRLWHLADIDSDAEHVRYWE